jgi:hypothetical protein
VASFAPVLAAPLIADVIDIFLPGLGIPIVLFGLAAFMFWVGIVSWRRNRRHGLHRRGAPSEAT